MKGEVLASDAALQALRPEWDTLWRRVPGATPFQSPAWLLAWWSAFGTGLPRVALLRREGRLAGVLPLYILEEAGQRKLLPIGVGITDYFDALIDPALGPAAAGRLLGLALAAVREDQVGACDLTDLPPGAAMREATLPAGWRGTLHQTDPCPVLQLPPDEAGLIAAIPRGKRRDLRLALNRARRIGGCSTEVADAESGPALLEALIALHQTRWVGQGSGAGLADPRVLAFHRAAVPELLACGVVRLQVLRFGPRIVAGFYALLAGRDRILFYLSGFDPAQARESPGTILLGRMIEDAVGEGRRELHFLRGGEGYKYQWGGVDRMNASRHLVPA
ncbi:MAG: GNAT family N-acetyltransferase [Acidisphaera sp.]|nr:GNAT family N-acetyltransferase [Acidisphaera sp.]